MAKTMSKYEEVYEQLKQRILDQTFPAKSYLPSEENLASLYQVSRETLRKSLRMLSSEGYIQKQAKKGNQVLRKDRHTLSATNLSSFREFIESQEGEVKSQTVVFAFDSVPWPRMLKGEAVERADSKVYYIARQRKLDGEAVIIDKDYIVKEVIPGLTREIAEQSVYNYIENVLNISIGYAKREIGVESITKEDRQYLDLGRKDTHLVVVRSRVYLADSRFFQYTESRHRLDKFKILEFAKRRNTW